MNYIISEVTPISDKDCFYLAERHKKEFSYPLHKHLEYELNFVAHCQGAQRVVGDSIEVVGEYDMALLGSGIEHEWQQHECQSADIHEITVQFAVDLVPDELLNKNHMKSIAKLLKDCHHGVVFEEPTILMVYEKLKDLLSLESGFYQLIKLYEILYDLSIANYRILASSTFANVSDTQESRRVKRVTDYVALHFKDQIRLKDLADLVGMSPTAFSRFFRLRTHKCISDYIIDVRLGHAARKLVDSSMSIVEICYMSGFNSVSYFIRTFKKKKGCTPAAFRENYRKTKLIV